jgi:hypothetical protein
VIELPPPNLNREPGSMEPVYISWSGLKRWEQCNHKHLRHIQHEVTKPNGRVFLPGTIVDRCERRLLESDNPQRGDMAAMIDTIFDENTGEDAEYVIRWKGKDEVKRTCLEAVTNLEPILWEHVLPHDYQAEFKFKAHMEVPYIVEGMRAPVTMRGGMDIVVQKWPSGNFAIHDLKISRDKGYINKTLAQGTFYAIAWGVIQEDFSQPTEVSFFFPLLEEKIIKATVGVEEKRMMMSRIVKYAQGVWKDEWYPKTDNAGCSASWCEAFGTCAKFKPIAMRDENGKQRVSFAKQAEVRRASRAPDRT